MSHGDFRGGRRVLRRAFTILELLVVAAIVALLVGLLVPALAGVRQNGRRAEDVALIRQVELAHVGYATDNRGRFADVGLPHGGATLAPERSFAVSLQPYLDHPRALRSPLDESPHWSAESGGRGVPIPGTSDRFRVTSYGANNFVTRFSPATATTGDPRAVADRLARVPAPSATVHLLHMVFTDDDGFCGADHVHVENWRIDPPRRAALQTQTDAVGGRAAGGDATSNYGFLDGHVETRSFDQVYVAPALSSPDLAPLNRFDPEVSAQFAVRIDG